jgi:hypothetical protein
MLISDHQQKLKKAMQKPLDQLISIKKEEPLQLASLTIIDQSIYSLILDVKQGLRDHPLDEIPIKGEDGGKPVQISRENQKGSGICLQRIYNEVYKFDLSQYCKAQSEQTEQIAISDEKIHINHLNNFKRKIHRIIRMKVSVKLPSDANFSQEFDANGKVDSSKNNQLEQDYQDLIAAEQGEKEEARRREGNEEEEELNDAKLRKDILDSFKNPTQQPNPQFSKLCHLRFKTFALKIGDWIRLFDPENPSKPFIGQIFDFNRLAPNTFVFPLHFVFFRQNPPSRFIQADFCIISNKKKTVSANDLPEYKKKKANLIRARYT